MKGPYKNIYIIRGSKDWYVSYEFEIPDRPGEYKEFKVRDGINRYHDPLQKELEVQRLYKDVARELKGGFDPFIIRQASAEIDKKLLEVAKLKEAAEGWTMGVAIDEYLKFIKKEGYSPRTIGTYKNYVDDLKDWLTEIGALDSKAATYNEFDLLTFIDTYTDERELSTRTYNNYLSFFGGFFNQCRKLEIKVRKKRGIKYEMDLSDIDLKITNPQRNRAYTPILAKAIKTELAKPGNENLKDYIEWIYLSLMRPDEIRELRIGNIDEENRQIRIVGKTGDRIVPITNQLMNLIDRRGLLSHSPNEYVFGYAGSIDNRRIGKEYFSSKYLIIKMNLDLDYDYTCYSWKHTAVIMLIKAGFKDEEIMVLSGHKTRTAFEKYKRDLVIDNSHVMKGEAIEF
jgi:integrase